MQKTLAMKLLEGKKISYDVFEYPEVERDASVIAKIFGVSPSDVFKTLVVDRPPAKPILVLVPADRQLNLKKLAKITGDKKLSMATHAEAERLTNLRVGGISPLALLNKGFVIYIDASVENVEVLFISSGRKGLNLRLKAQDLLAAINAQIIDCTDAI